MPVFIYNAAVERYTFIFRWRHTVLPMIAKDPIFWLMVVLHPCLIYYQALLETTTGTPLPSLDWKASSTIGALLTFFVIFYGGQCYGRYFEAYGSCVGLGAALGEWAYLVRAHFGAFSPAVKWNLLRLMLGALEIEFAILGGTDDSGGKSLNDDEWATIQRHGFLSGKEVATLQRYRGAKSFLPTVWALSEARAALKAKLQRIAPKMKDTEMPASNLAQPVFKKPQSLAAEHHAENALLHTPAAMLVFEDFEKCVLRFKGHCGQAEALMRMPVPYAYFHVLKLLLIISLSMTSYALVELENHFPIVSYVVFMLICTIMLGLQNIAVAMSDPFGSDDLDFDLDAFLKSAFDNAIALVTDQHASLHDRLPSDVAENPLLDSERARRGRTWAGDRKSVV